MESIDSSGLANIRQTVQHNCAISDARFARDYSLCIYLLRMREFYRWKNGISLGAKIDTEALGAWVSDTEAHWDEIEETEYAPLIIDDISIEPFNTTAVNLQLKGTGLVYSAGIGRFGQPHFILARQLQHSVTDDIECIECGDELARDTITMPAMAQNRTIFIRQESITHLLWQMIDEWSIRKPPGPMARIIDRYSIKLNVDHLDNQIAPAARELSDLLRQHEFGEIAAGESLGEAYTDMTQSFLGKRGEMQIRAVRDLLADTLRTWPFIVREQSSMHLDFWLAGLNGYREILLKQTPVLEQLQTESADTQLKVLTGLIEPEQIRWRNIAMTLVQAYQQQGTDLDVESTIKHCLSNTQ